eukprot:TRINITY_DN17057_c0_g1_i5.p1 TRINITY_DN17057_c0_g1~~TRINITY_DN17057_c0_g1_i5.p1  ORF type:complete len:364 (-),score=118.74 TRINITY_DN17057_c0_g1_i5:65-1156(-)
MACSMKDTICLVAPPQEDLEAPIELVPLSDDDEDDAWAPMWREVSPTWAETRLPEEPQEVSPEWFETRVAGDRQEASFLQSAWFEPIEEEDEADLPVEEDTTPIGLVPLEEDDEDDAWAFTCAREVTPVWADGRRTMVSAEREEAAFFQGGWLEPIEEEEEDEADLANEESTTPIGLVPLEEDDEDDAWAFTCAREVSPEWAHAPTTIVLEQREEAAFFTGAWFEPYEEEEAPFIPGAWFEQYEEAYLLDDEDTRPLVAMNLLGDKQEAGAPRKDEEEEDPKNGGGGDEEDPAQVDFERDADKRSEADADTDKSVGLSDSEASTGCEASDDGKADVSALEEDDHFGVFWKSWTEGEGWLLCGC